MCILNSKGNPYFKKHLRTNILLALPVELKHGAVQAKIRNFTDLTRRVQLSDGDKSEYTNCLRQQNGPDEKTIRQQQTFRVLTSQESSVIELALSRNVLDGCSNSFTEIPSYCQINSMARHNARMLFYGMSAK